MNAANISEAGAIQARGTVLFPKNPISDALAAALAAMVVIYVAAWLFIVYAWTRWTSRWVPPDVWPVVEEGQADEAHERRSTETVESATTFPTGQRE
ncbi:hypothetical protein GGR52DRAFT_568953 [Hypoxylon sp. FL1284]|nr:hypothetical protein GGR52DRAFT_568953 [Hypoxylon sp. FL1284]